MSHVTKSVTHITVIVIQSYNIEKNKEGSRIDNIIQYNNNILAL